MKSPIVVRAELIELPKIDEDDPGIETVVAFVEEEGGGHVILSQDALQAIHKRIDSLGFLGLCIESHACSLDNLRERQDEQQQQIEQLKKQLEQLTKSNRHFHP